MRYYSRLCPAILMFFVVMAPVLSNAQDNGISPAGNAAIPALVDSGKPATVSENRQIISQGGTASAVPDAKDRPLLPERPSNFNPMTSPGQDDGDGAPQAGSQGISALYMGQLATYIGQLAFFTRCLLAGMIMLVIILIALAFYLHHALSAARKSADAAMLSAEQARQSIAGLRKLLQSHLFAQEIEKEQGAGGAPE